jgi:lipid II:glycine glycyltransferase (peptidoglycan interpeptide bridge formation enzyme)
MDKDAWNQFVIENSGLFLQSWEWGEFQESLGRKIWRLGDGESWQAVVVKYDFPMGKNYLYCPAGPIISNIKAQSEKPQLKAQNFLDELRKIAIREKSIFLKIEPFWGKGETLRQAQGINFNDLKFIKSDGGQRILKTLVLDLNKSEDELLAEMKQKTRYNIRLAEKQGVKIKVSNNLEKDIDIFYQLAKETAKRDGFDIHLKEHYEKMFFTCHSERSEESQEIEKEISRPAQGGARNDKLFIELFLAEYQNKIIAANIVVFFGSRAIYLHGASSNERRNLMAPYLLQWEQIKEAKKRGCQIYDFWGISEENWPGVTRFKKGFGGKEIDYVGTCDYIFRSIWYMIYRAAKKLF